MPAWKVPKIWEGGECWIIGGGPSVTKQFNVPDDIVQKVLLKELPPSAYSPYLTPIHDKHVIGVNAAFLIGDWIDMVFFGDKGWFIANRKQLAKFPGLKVTCHPKFKSQEFAPERIKYLQRDRERGKGISPNKGKVCWNGNSGAAAISVAANAGAKRIILLGFDMKLNENNKQHWHGLYGTARRKKIEPKKLPFARHLHGFPMIARDAKERDIEIINACPDSAIDVFPRRSVCKILGAKRITKGFVVPLATQLGKRFNWLNKIIRERKYKIGAEVGSHTGTTTKSLLKHNYDLHLYAVDLWGPVPDEVGGGTQYKGYDFKKNKRRFNEVIGPFLDRITVLKGLSWEMANEVEDETLDFVFLDADHEYESVIKDIRAWTPKLKSNGTLCGHDSNFEGVKKAIDELIPNWIDTKVEHVWECKKEDVKL